uniref:Uncharacterized protein n=1 Tax=Anguilla anguilla TaxID=7936 RepID=A0A0E9QLD7_ANGAN
MFRAGNPFIRPSTSTRMSWGLVLGPSALTSPNSSNFLTVVL